MHCEISCESAPGKATCFSFTALFDPGKAQGMAAKPDLPADGRSKGGFGRRVSVHPEQAHPAGRGEPVSQMAARELPTALGARVDTADDGLEAGMPPTC